MDLAQCSLCYQVIPKGNSIYRAFDNTYCSRICLNKKCYTMDTIDPGYKTPAKWHQPNTECLIEIPHEIEEPEKSESKNFIDSNVSKLSLVKYSYIIATSVAIVGLKTVLSNNYNAPYIV